MPKLGKNDNITPKRQFRQIISKIDRVFEKVYINNHAKFQSDGCNHFRVIARQKIDNLRTHAHTLARTHTHTHRLSENDFFSI